MGKKKKNHKPNDSLASQPGTPPASQNMGVPEQRDPEERMLMYVFSCCSDKTLPALEWAKGSVSGSCKVLFKNWKVHVNKAEVLLFLQTALGFSLW